MLPELHEKHDVLGDHFWIAGPDMPPIPASFETAGGPALTWLLVSMESIPSDPSSEVLPRNHRFLDECGDTTFFGKGRAPVLGQNGVSLAFGLGLVKFNVPVDEARAQVKALAQEIESDEFFRNVPSVLKRSVSGGFYFHAKDDLPEIRERLFRWIKASDVTLELVMARKIPGIFARKHGGHEKEFYARTHPRARGSFRRPSLPSSQTQAQAGPAIGDQYCFPRFNDPPTHARSGIGESPPAFCQKHDAAAECCEVVFNVQTPQTEPLLSVADYLSWSVQRVFERGETRYYDFVQERVAVVVDLYDFNNYEKGRNYYTPKRPLTAANKLSPPSP